MFLTIEELYALKEQYIDELNKAQAKVAVVGDLIKLAESKVVEPVCEEEAVETEEVAYEESAVDGIA